MDKAKPFSIPKREVWEAFKRVKANQGAAGVDGQSVAAFEADLSNNLKSAIAAVAKARQRCWRHEWVLDLDIRAFFDSLDWELMLAAVRRHTDCAWLLLYVERWLKAPVEQETARLSRAGRGRRKVG